MTRVAALNWPMHRGTATAFPLAAFGLSAFFFSALSSLAFPGNASSFLLLMSIGTFLMTFIPFFFLHVVPPTSSYSAVPSDSDQPEADSNVLRRKSSEESRRRTSRDVPGESEGRSGDTLEDADESR